MRKFTMATLIAALTSSAAMATDLANTTCPIIPKLKTGWYLGFEGGYDSYRTRQNINYADPALAIGSPHINMSPVYNATGWVGGMIAGYGMMLNPWLYIGGEVFANNSFARYETSQLVSTGTSYTNKLLINGTYGVGVLPGILMTDGTLTFIRLGINRSSLRITETLTSTIPTFTQMVSTHNTTGYVIGVGMETLTADNWSLRAEYDHVRYSAYKTPTPFITTINASDNQMMAAIIYHFNS